MNEQLRLKPLGNDKYRVLVMGRADGRLSIFVRTAKELLQNYVQQAEGAFNDLGYTGDRNEFARDIAVAWYAANCHEADTPRAVFWSDDTKEQVLVKLRDVICFQKEGRTINQHPTIEEIFSRLNFGIVADDSLGYARGQALRALISATFGREESPIVYFDKIRRYPQYVFDLNGLLEHFGMTEDYMEQFDPDFHDYFIERLEAATNVMKSEMSLDEANPAWSKYREDFGDYHGWLDKRRQQ